MARQQETEGIHNATTLARCVACTGSGYRITDYTTPESKPCHWCGGTGRCSPGAVHDYLDLKKIYRSHAIQLTGPQVKSYR